jgi:hypothetical protein
MQNYVLSSNTKKGEIERAFPAYSIFAFVNNKLSINVWLIFAGFYGILAQDIEFPIL